MNRSRTFFITLLLLATLGASFAAGSENVELYMTKAIHALNIQDDARAFAWFEKVLSIEPDNAKALHLQGLAAMRLGRLKRAETILKRCIAQPNAPVAAHFDLGYVLYAQGRYREAMVEFDVAYHQNPNEPVTLYYRGASLFRIGDYKGAIASLEQVGHDLPESAANVNYYLGVSHFALEQYLRAQYYLERAIELAPGTPLAARARRLLAEAKREQRYSKWWDISMEIGGSYDSNVLYEPEDLDVTDQEGFLGFTAFNGTVYPVKNKNGSVGVGYSYYQSIHYAADNETISDFDLQRHAGRLHGAGRIKQIISGLDYEYSYASLGGEHYQDTHDVFPYLTLVESLNFATRAGVTFQQKDFYTYDERDAVFMEPILGQLFSFMDGGGKAIVEAGYQQNDAESDFYDYWGVRGFAGGMIPIVGGLAGILEGQYRYLEYLHHPEDRIDRKITAESGLRFSFLRFFAVQGMYRFARNVSLDRYTWTKHVGSLSFLVSF